MSTAVLNARRTDPETSRAAAGLTKVKASNADHLLAAFVGRPHGLTQDEAGDATGLTEGHWKRISDLQRDGYLVVKSSEDARPGKSNRLQQVRYITSKGEQRIHDLVGTR